MLKGLRRQVAKEKNRRPSSSSRRTPWIHGDGIPHDHEELRRSNGVSKGKALRFGRKFIDLIAGYVEARIVSPTTS